jgi:acyl-CoA synthetase (AMP-forming)/AMP-acid ligase II
MATSAGGLPFGFAEVAAFLDRIVDLGTPLPRGHATFADVVADQSSLGLPPGSTVAIALSNGRRLLEHYFATLLTGNVPVTASPATSSARIDRLARELGAGAIIAARLDRGRTGAAAVGDADAVVLPAAERRPRNAGEVLILTSGTSGMFSACLHRVDSLIRNARRHADAVGLRGDDTVLVNLPLFYSYAIVAQAFAALVTGARLVISGPPFSPAAYLTALAQHDVTSSSVTPTIARLLLAHGERLPARTRMLTIGGDSVDPAHVAALLSSNPDIELYLTYGLAEAGPRVSTLAAHREPASRHGSVGLPLAGVTTTLRPANGHGDAGELLVATDTALLEKLGSSVVGRTLVAPGVIATGDLFRIDDDAYLHFVGRLSDFVVVRGEKVPLSAVRQFVRTLPGVVRCATRVGVDAAGATYFDLDVHVGDNGAGTEQRIRHAVGSFLLPGERPRAITVDHADPAVFQK